MRNWNTDKIVGAGLILALIFSLLGWLVISVVTGKIPALDFQTNLVTGLAGYMGRSLLERKTDGEEKTK